MTSHRPAMLTDIDPATDHLLGTIDAPVMVLEYGDFAALSCAQACPELDMLRAQCGAQLALVFRHFPERTIHPFAEMAAEASEAMGAQGYFWPYHDLLFAHHAHLSERSLREDAQRLGADLQRFDAELHEHVWLQRVQEHMEGARSLGIRAMPTFFVNGVRVDVSFGMHHLADAVEGVLRQKFKFSGRKSEMPGDTGGV